MGIFRLPLPVIVDILLGISQRRHDISDGTKIGRLSHSFFVCFFFAAAPS